MTRTAPNTIAAIAKSTVASSLRTYALAVVALVQNGLLTDFY